MDPRKVLFCLNQLGYTNINAQQLKDFIIDLKKLIKFDHREYYKEKICREQNQVQEDLIYTLNQNIYSDYEQEKIASTDLHNHHTIASKAKEMPKNKVITVQISKPKPKHEHCIHVENDNESETVQESNQVKEIQESEPTISSAQRSGTLAPVPSLKLPKCKKCSSQSKKTDPVTLYHKYKSEWDKCKFPGEEKQFAVRKAVREKMMQKPNNYIASTSTVTKRRKNFCKA